MASSPDNISMAVFCDFENVALGVRDANYEKFDIKPVLERLLLKGSIVVKKSYCDWDRYKGFKAGMHEANFELIEIPHVRQSGKNSADIRLVVDALDLCYTKAHVNTFVIVSGDSDFSPLVSKLRENAKRVIGVGVKNSTSDLLVANCDEFIFYDDLVREQRRAAAKRDERKAQPQPAPAEKGRRPSDEGNKKREEMEARKLQALDMVAETFDALVSERGDTGKIWASLLKDTLKRRRPEFSETYFGFRTFGNLLEEAQTRGLFEFGRDEKSGTYVYRNPNVQSDPATGDPLATAPAAPVDGVPAAQDALEAADAGNGDAAGGQAPAADADAPAREPRRRGGRGRKGREQAAEQANEAPAAVNAASTELGAETAGEGAHVAPTPDLAEADADDTVAAEAPQAAADAVDAAHGSAARDALAAELAPTPASAKERRRAPRAPRKPAVRKDAVASTPDVTPQADADAAAAVPADASGDLFAAAPVATPAQDDAGALAAETWHDVAEAKSAADDAEDAGTAQAGSEESAEDADAKVARKKTLRPSHKAPSRKPAPRARRPAKPKTPDNG